MKNQKIKKGFTLMELLVTIAIIGILAGVTMVSMQGSVDKSKKASAITTMSSILPELVTCADDNGSALEVAPSTTAYVCCKDDTASNGVSSCDQNLDTERAAGHSVKWPNILTKTGYNYAGTPTGSLKSGNYIFFATKSGQNKIICDYAANACCEDTTGSMVNCQ